MDWARDYYHAQSETFARGTITDQHRAIATRLEGWCVAQPRCDRVLELGAGAGGTAAALVDLGRDVTAVEFNPSDVGHARALAAERPGLHVVEADFYTVDLDGRFDFVFYWDGFGIGRDADQRRLLQRIGDDWLAPGGRVLIDVFSPWNWARHDGETSTYTAKDGTTWERRVEFDAISSCFHDHWTPLPTREVHRSQTLRCYTLQEFILLLEGTGLETDTLLGMDGRVLDPTARDPETSAYLATTNGYFALLRTGASPECPPPRSCSSSDSPPG